MWWELSTMTENLRRYTISNKNYHIIQIIIFWPIFKPNNEIHYHLHIKCPHNFWTEFIKNLPEKVRKVGTTNYKFFMHLQEVELCDGFHLKSVVRNPKVLIRPHEKARQQRQTLIWWKPRPLAFHEVNS